MSNQLREFHDMVAILEADVAHFSKSSFEDQVGRRMYIRALFALVEGIVYRMKQICLSEQFGSRYNFSSGELGLLREESYELDDKGQVITKPSKLQLQKNVKFTFEAFSKCFGLNFKLKIDDSGWESFLKAIKIRNRLMHPKLIEDLNVSDEELKIAKRANSWFENSIAVSLNDASDVLEKENETLKGLTESVNSFLAEVSERKST